MDIFVDPQLRARQDQLNAQWIALKSTVDNCQLDPVSAAAFSQFYADFASWQSFYESGSDWTSSSKKATDDWQSKLQEYTKTVGGGFCSQSQAGDSSYIPGVKDPPPDEPGFIQSLADKAAAAGKTAYWTGTVFVFAIVAAIVLMFYFASKSTKVSVGV